MSELQLRVAQEEDAPALLEIYRPYVLNTTYTFEGEVPDEEEFRSRIRTFREGYPYLILQDGGEIIGYAYAHRYRERAAYAWDAELSIYLRQGLGGHGYGKLLYTALERLLARQNVVNLYALVTVPNEASDHLHQHCGFRLVGTMDRAGYKLGGWHGIRCYEKRILPAEIPQPLIPFFQLPSVDTERILGNCLKEYTTNKA